MTEIPADNFPEADLWFALTELCTSGALSARGISIGNREDFGKRYARYIGEVRRRDARSPEAEPRSRSTTRRPAPGRALV